MPFGLSLSLSVPLSLSQSVSIVSATTTLFCYYHSDPIAAEPGTKRTHGFEVRAILSRSRRWRRTRSQTGSHLSGTTLPRNKPAKMKKKMCRKNQKKNGSICCTGNMSNLGRNTCPSCCCCCSECLNIARTICERARVNDRRAALRWEYLVPAKRRSFARQLTNRDKTNTERHFLCECSFLRLKESNTKKNLQM